MTFHEQNRWSPPYRQDRLQISRVHRSMPSFNSVPFPRTAHPRASAAHRMHEEEDDSLPLPAAPSPPCWEDSDGETTCVSLVFEQPQRRRTEPWRSPAPAHEHEPRLRPRTSDGPRMFRDSPPPRTPHFNASNEPRRMSLRDSLRETFRDTPRSSPPPRNLYGTCACGRALPPNARMAMITPGAYAPMCPPCYHARPHFHRD